ncbi:MAG: lactate permease [Campylobacterota bacterium]
MNSIDRHKKRKILLEQSRSSTVTQDNNVSQSLVNEFLHSKVDTNLINSMTASIDNHYQFEYDFSVSSEEAKEFLEQFKNDFNQARFDKLIIDCKQNVISSIVTPFGLGKVIAVYDKVGGNVDTIHNVRNKDKIGIGMSEEESKKDGLGIYATTQAKEAYSNRGEYNSDEYHKDINYIDINKQYSKDRKDGKAFDYMTGETLSQNESHDLDHIKSAKEIHDDPGRVLAGLDGADLANTETNLAPTTATSNRSKKADDMETFLKKKNERIKKINDLKGKGNLSEQETKELKKLEELAKIDDEKALKADEQARKAIDKEINREYYTSGDFAKNTTITSANEGVKMGMQQAIGLVMTEFFTALFDEILDIYKNGFAHGFDESRFVNILKERLKRIASRLQAKWKDVALAFKDGFLSGFISNLTTTAINMFVTTGARVVRIIREGIFSLFKAIKMLIFPPENMTYEEAMHEAKKIIASGLIISAGVIVEQYLDTLIKGSVILEPFSDILTTIFVGAITGIAVTMTVYYIDKKKNDKEAIQELLRHTDKKFDNVESSLQQLEIKLL